MEAYLARQSKTGTKLENRVQRVVHLSLRVEDGRGSQYTEGEGDGYRKIRTVGRGVKIRC